MSFGIVGLLVVLAVVAVLAKKSASIARAPVVAPAGVQAPAGNVRAQSQLIQQQVRQQLDAAMQQARERDPDSQ